MSYGQFDDRARPIGGININLTDRIAASALFDGVKVHPLVTYSFGRHQVGVLLAQGKNPGITYSFTF